MRARIAMAVLAVILSLGVAAPARATGTREGGTVRSSGDHSLVIAEDGVSLTCVDAYGATVTLRKRPARTIINYTSLVSLWYRAGGIAVGMPETANLSELPEAARGLPSTGRTTAPNVERILELEPTFVVLSTAERQRALRDTLESSGVATLSLAYETYADYVGILDLFYRLNGLDPAGDAGVVAIADAVSALAARTRALPAPSFLSLFASTKSVVAETDAAHTAFMAAYLGARNIVAADSAPSGAKRVAFSLERVHMEDPDVILVTTMGDSAEVLEAMRRDLYASDAWKGLRAVREGRVYFLPNEFFLYKPNERFPEAFAALAEYLYPASRP